MNSVYVLDENYKLSIKRTEIKIIEEDDKDLSYWDFDSRCKKKYTINAFLYVSSYIYNCEIFHKIINESGEIIATNNKIFFDHYGAVEYLEKINGKVDEDFYIEFKHFNLNSLNLNIYKRELSRQLSEINKKSSPTLYLNLESEIESVNKLIEFYL